MTKIIDRILLFALLLSLPACTVPKSRETEPEIADLRFGADGRFKIVQFTDTHIRWDDQESYAKSVELQESILETEKPDLVIFTGDVVTDIMAAEAWEDFLMPCDERGIPFVAVMGNHDKEQTLTTSQLAEAVIAHPMCLNTSSDGVLDDLAVEVKSRNGDNVAAVLYCFDSGDYSQSPDVRQGYGWMRWDQISWYRSRSTAYTRCNDGVPVPSYAFFHIPLPEYREAFSEGGAVCGTRGENECTGAVNSGIFAAFQECGDIHACFAGHDHSNDYVTLKDGIALCYGRYSGGSTSYHGLPSGARVIELTEGDYGLRTWVREPESDPADEYVLHTEVDYALRHSSAAEAREHGLRCIEYKGTFGSPDEVPEGEIGDTVMLSIPYMPRMRDTGSHGCVLEGKLYVPETGVWLLHATAYLYGTLTIDDWTISGRKRFQGGVNLEKGYHDIRIVFTGDPVSERLRLQWRKITDPRYRDIPAENVYIR